jgi:hypothetical protein
MVPTSARGASWIYNSTGWFTKSVTLNRYFSAAVFLTSAELRNLKRGSVFFSLTVTEVTVFVFCIWVLGTSLCLSLDIPGPHFLFPFMTIIATPVTCFSSCLSHITCYFPKLFHFYPGDEGNTFLESSLPTYQTSGDMIQFLILFSIMKWKQKTGTSKDMWNMYIKHCHYHI